MIRGRSRRGRSRPSVGLAPTGGESEETRDYRKILNSNRLRVEERREVEFVEKLQANAEALIEQARRVAAEQAGKMFKCHVCGPELLGILAFAEHDDETSHMTDRGKKVQVGGQDLVQTLNAPTS